MSKRILVIEDDRDIAELVDLALSDRYDIRVMTDISNIPDIIREFNPDLIMLDNYVGNKQSKEIVKEIRLDNQEKNIPIVLFSGHADIENIAKEINATTFLSKPFGLNELYECINGLLADN